MSCRLFKLIVFVFKDNLSTCTMCCPLLKTSVLLPGHVIDCGVILKEFLKWISFLNISKYFNSGKDNGNVSFGYSYKVFLKRKSS
jgi:hypothetical protein